MAKYSYNYLICQEVQLIANNYNEPINIVTGLTFRQKDLIRTIEFYSNSKYLNGQLDELGREKPFYNIINAMCDVENAAKDIDTKNVQATSDDGNHYMETFLLAKDVYQWMKKSGFAKTLNDMRDHHTRYGSLLVKKYFEFDDDGNKILKIGIPEWKNTITDQVDIINGPIIECHYMPIMDIVGKKSWDQDGIEELLEKCKKMSGYSYRVPVLEVRGYFPKSFIKELKGQEATAKDKTTFSYQLYYLALPTSDYALFENPDVGSLAFGSKLIPLFWEDNTEKCYKYLARKKKAGRAFGVGVSEEGEEAQVWTNDTVLKQFRAMEFTTKVVGQTASKKLKGRNLLNEVDDGTILEHEDGKPITALSLLPAGGLGQYAGLIAQWFTQFERATSAYSAQRGESPTSRTAAKLQTAVLQQSGAVMNNIREDFGIFLTELFEDWIMPWLAKQLNTEHILSHDFSLTELEEIDKNFAVHHANDIAKEMMLSGKAVTIEDYKQFQQKALEDIRRTKTHRFLMVPKNYYKKVKAKITFNITGEQQDKQAVSEVLTNIMKIYVANPQLILDPVLTQIFLKIVEVSGAGINPSTIISALQARAQEAAQNQEAGSSKISESINFKDLPPEGKVQMAEKVGIKIQPPAPEVPPQAGLGNAATNAQ